MDRRIENLGQLLVQKGLISPAQLADCLQAHREATGRGAPADLSDIIVSRGIMTAESMTRELKSLGWSSMADPSSRYGRDETPPEVLEARRDPRRVLGKYTLIGEVGRGGMAVVYRAWDETLGKHVALKLIRAQDLGLGAEGPGEDVQEFQRGARTAVKLSHPNIVRVYEIGRHEDRHYLSMEFIEGKTLTELLRPDRKRPPCTDFFADPPKFLRILRDVSLALEHAHAQTPPIVHRDVKPQNILVDPQGRACVVDFGLAKEMKGGNTLTVSGIVKGTPCYMAPEQAQGRSGQGVDARTDVWALGAILYEYLAGIPPFLGASSREILNKVVGEEPASPSEIHARRGSPFKAPLDLEKICLRALEKDKARRYASAAEFAEEVDRFLSGRKVQAKTVRRYERVFRQAGRNRAAAAALALAVLMGIVAVVALSRRNRTERIVETVVVEGDVTARLREATGKIEAIAGEMQFDRAARAYQELLTTVKASKDREKLQGALEEVRLQEALIAELVARIREQARDFARFELDDAVLEDARLLDATPDRLILRYAGRAVEVPWGKLVPTQFIALVRQLCPRLSGEPALGFLAWCTRNGAKESALRTAENLLKTPSEARARDLLARANLKLKEPEKPVEPPPAPAPPPPPQPVKVAIPSPPPTPVEPPKPVVPAYAESPLPASATAPYIEAWKHHGAPLAEGLIRRGWTDLAEEVVLNSLRAPGITEDGKAEGAIVLARLHAARLDSTADPDERLRLLDWSTRRYRNFLLAWPRHARAGEALAELCRQVPIRARALIAAGFPKDAANALTDVEALCSDRLSELEKAAGTARAAAPKEALVLRYSRALLLLSKMEALRGIPSENAGHIGAAVALRKYLEDDFMWRADGRGCAAQACVLLAAAHLRLLNAGRHSDADPCRAALKRAREILSQPEFKLAPVAAWTLRRIEVVESLLKDPKATADPFASFYDFPPSGAEMVIPAPGIAFAQRMPAARPPLLKKAGGTTETEAAVQAALVWLARHQEPDGRWGFNFSNQCVGGRCSGPGGFGGWTKVSRPSTPFRQGTDVPQEPEPASPALPADWQSAYETGTTGLALLAFLGAGYTHTSPDEVPDSLTPGRSLRFGEVVRKGLRWLASVQDPEGCLGMRGSKYLYGHAIGGTALVEAYGMTGSLLLKEPAQKALDFSSTAQNPGKGWRYSFKCGDNDTSVTGWMVIMYKSAELAGLAFPKAAYDGTLTWLDEVTDNSGYYHVGYNAKGTGKVYVPGRNEVFDGHPAMSSVGVLCRLIISRNKGAPTLEGVKAILSDLPEWKSDSIDFYYWYCSSMALFQHEGPEGPAWKKWNQAVKDALIPNLKSSAHGCQYGSWDPAIDRWGFEGGRIYATAINALTLETYYRYPSFLGKPKK